MTKIKMISLNFQVEGKEKCWLIRPEDIRRIKVFNDSVYVEFVDGSKLQPFNFPVDVYEKEIKPYLDIINEEPKRSQHSVI